MYWVWGVWGYYDGGDVRYVVGYELVYSFLIRVECGDLGNSSCSW